MQGAATSSILLSGFWVDHFCTAIGLDLSLDFNFLDSLHISFQPAKG